MLQDHVEKTYINRLNPNSCFFLIAVHEADENERICKA
jgi:hypothetical protein